MKKVAVVTSTRAEYGLLSPVIKKIRTFENDDFRCNLVVTGTHLSKEFGYTIEEIDDRIDHRLFISVKAGSEYDIAHNQAEALVLFTEHFMQEKYDGIIVLGDRYEMLAVAIAAGNTKTPVFHLCGGDTTEGAMDEWVRHAITKISYLHFVTNEESRKRVIQLGENPERVFNFGSTSIDNILSITDMTKADALESIGLNDCKYAICTFHPVTMEYNTFEEQVTFLLEAIKSYPEIEFIVTKSNADQGGAKINDILDAEVDNIRNMHLYTSLGAKRYLSLMRYAEFVIGNSSSGIIETPAFHIPTINIGDRQKGRLQATSIINCKAELSDIINAIKKSISKEFRLVCAKSKSLYGEGHAAEQIAEKIFEVIMSGNIELKKKFYDIE